MTNNVAMSPESRAIILIKDALNMLTDATEKKFNNIETTIAGIEALIDTMKDQMPPDVSDTVKDLLYRIQELDDRLTDLENSRKREVKTFLERVESIENQLEHHKDAIRTITNKLQEMENKDGKKGDKHGK